MSGNTRVSKLLSGFMRECARSHFGEPMRERALAKVNLRLKVLGRRDDGYHRLSMCNCSVGLHDDVEVVLTDTPGVVLTVEPAGVLNEPLERNLAVRAFDAFWRAFDLEEAPVGCHITLHKRIPIGAGLGGGSSDAGAVLRILTHAFGAVIEHELGLSDESLLHTVANCGLSCGADVPYAFSGGPAWVTGIGGEITPLGGLPVWRGEVLVIVPGAPVPTAAFYDFYRERHPSLPEKRDPVMEEVARKPAKADLMDLIDNDFESDVSLMVPEVGEALSVVRRVFPQGTGLTGCGSALFTLLPEGREDDLAELTRIVEPRGMTIHRCRMQSPPPVF